MGLNIYFALVLLDFSNEFKKLFASQLASLKAKQNPFTSSMPFVALKYQ